MEVSWLVDFVGGGRIYFFSALISIKVKLTGYFLVCQSLFTIYDTGPSKLSGDNEYSADRGNRCSEGKSQSSRKNVVRAKKEERRQKTS